MGDPSNMPVGSRNGLRPFHKELRLYGMDSVDQFVKIHGAEYLGRFLQVSIPSRHNSQMNSITSEAICAILVTNTR